MNITVQDILNLFPNATFRGDASVLVRSFQIDSRQVTANDVFVALPGEHVDGHDFICDALQRKAALCLSQKNLLLAQVLVCDDTVLALATIAKWYRQKIKSHVIGITGSNGKTTTKDLLAHVLKTQGQTQATQGNLNNHLGVPLTLLSFDTQAKFSVVEMGMSNTGEIAALCDIAKPNVGLITSIGPAHMEHFAGNIANIAKAKAELFSSLTAHDVAIVNQDEPLIRTLSTQAKRITFGLHADADVRAQNIVPLTDGCRFEILCAEKTFVVTLPLIGEHHVQNALGVFAIAFALKLNLQEIADAFASFTPNRGRGQCIPFWGGVIMDDTYNANPASMQAAFATLRARYPDHMRIAVLGDMFELGTTSRFWHQSVGQAAKKSGMHSLYALGENAKYYCEDFASGQAQHFQDALSLAKKLKLDLQGKSNIALLFKGSRGMKMESVLVQFLA